MLEKVGEEVLPKSFVSEHHLSSDQKIKHYESAYKRKQDYKKCLESNYLGFNQLFARTRKVTKGRNFFKVSLMSAVNKLAEATYMKDLFVRFDRKTLHKDRKENFVNWDHMKLVYEQKQEQ